MEDTNRVVAMPDSNSIPQKRYVRVRETLENGFVEFDFSIDDPQLYVELILPEQAFWEFCTSNRVSFLSTEEGKAIDSDRERWRDATSDDLK